MMDPRTSITEWNLGKFLDTMEFQSWKLNFRTEVSMRTADLQVTMQWIKEIEVANQLTNSVASRSVTGQTKIHDFDMLDAMISSALRKLINTQFSLEEAHQHAVNLPKKSAEEQRAQKIATESLTRKDKLLT